MATAPKLSEKKLRRSEREAKKKAKKLHQKQAQEEEHAAKDADKAVEGVALKAKQAAQEDTQRKKREEEHARREAARKAAAEEERCQLEAASLVAVYQPPMPKYHQKLAAARARAARWPAPTAKHHSNSNITHKQPPSSEQVVEPTEILGAESSPIERKAKEDGDAEAVQQRQRAGKHSRPPISRPSGSTQRTRRNKGILNKHNSVTPTPSGSTPRQSLQRPLLSVSQHATHVVPSMQNNFPPHTTPHCPIAPGMMLLPLGSSSPWVSFAPHQSS
ncbi:uncharacterized protein EDB91DRAFT_1346412 [Suillus paluster]|uniref:uncharacterized protein n=1 Tax=Suillus paluster TaxID=48578 RepID=UPI001B8849B7|nr:uncharacterized protein EDB91DRAFT_1346412 [Suillus paluster]KAG1742636.1 hypothetical protein EDB91DRAFT_1346412 [Suillus paluster]